MTDLELRKTGPAPIARLAPQNFAALTKFLLQLSKLSTALLFGAYIVEVMMRYFFNRPTSWALDYSTWLLGVTIILALPEVTRLGANITIEVFLEKIPGRARVTARRIILLACFLACGVTTFICANETWRQFQQGILTDWTHPIAKGWVSVVIPVGFGLCSLIFLVQALRPTSSPSS